MALIPIIQPPIMKLLTTKKERAIKMEQLRVVSKKERILFPIITAILVILIVPDTASLIGMLMLGNLFKESLHIILPPITPEAVPMAARVAQNVGQKENPNNYLLMHAMGPNVAGVIGSAIASGIFLQLYRG